MRKSKWYENTVLSRGEYEKGLDEVGSLPIGEPAKAEPEAVEGDAPKEPKPDGDAPEKT